MCPVARIPLGFCGSMMIVRSLNFNVHMDVLLKPVIICSLETSLGYPSVQMLKQSLALVASRYHFLVRQNGKSPWRTSG